MAGFGKINLDEMAIEGDRLSSKGNSQGNDIFMMIPIPQKGGSRIVFPVRLLPPREGGKLFQYNRIHKVKGKTVTCPKDLVMGKRGKPVWDWNTYCPICKYVDDLYNRSKSLASQGRTEEADKLGDEAYSLKGMERYYYNAIARQYRNSKNEVERNVGPKVLSVGKKLHEIIVHAFRGDPDNGIKGIGDVSDVQAGYDLLITVELTVTGKREYPNYDRSEFARDKAPSGTPEELKIWAEKMHDLAALRKPSSEEELEYQLARHLGAVTDEETGFDVNALKSKYTRSTTTQILVPENKLVDTSGAPLAAGTVEESDNVVPPEDMSIPDDAFMSELQEIVDAD